MAAKSLDWKAVVKSTGLRLVVMMVGLYLVSGILEPNYLQPSHIMSTLVLCCFLGIICIGQTLIILTGGADLSVAYSVTFSACVFAQTTKETGNGWIGFAAAMLVGILMGLFKGVGVAYLKITPMVMTLATNSILMSATFLYTQGVLKGESTAVVTALAKDSFLGIRYCVLLWVALGIATIFLLKKTTFGRKIFAVGCSPRVTDLSGINTRVVLVGVYVIASVMMADRPPGLSQLHHGRQLSADLHRGGGHRRHLHPGRPRRLSGDHGRCCDHLPDPEHPDHSEYCRGGP